MNKALKQIEEEIKFSTDYLIQCLNDTEQKVHTNSEKIEFCLRLASALQTKMIYEKEL